MAEGTAINDQQNPDRALDGDNNKAAVNKPGGIYSNWVDSSRAITTNLCPTELAKIRSNAFMAQRRISMNTIAGPCEATRPEIEEVRSVIDIDRRISNEFLKPGPGFGGIYYKKDLKALIYLAERYGLIEMAYYSRTIVELNRWSQKNISRMIVKSQIGTLRDKRITVLSFAFKAETNDTRESPSKGIHDPPVEECQVSIRLMGAST
jgi:UDPglucose 6-dehydrogenase